MEVTITQSKRIRSGDHLPRCVLLCLLLVAIHDLGCGSTPIQYDKGTFRFDWRKHRSVTEQRRRSFERQFDRNVRLLQVKLQDGAVLDAVRISNQRSRNITAEQIAVLDRKWRNSGEEIARQLTDAKCNESLKLFQNSFKGFAEIFVANARGLNVCQTNKTTDYYQADEDWWERAFKGGELYRHSSLEFDESAGVFAIPVHLPVRDPANGRVIGAAKAIVLESPATER